MTSTNTPKHRAHSPRRTHRGLAAGATALMAVGLGGGVAGADPVQSSQPPSQPEIDRMIRDGVRTAHDTAQAQVPLLPQQFQEQARQGIDALTEAVAPGLLLELLREERDLGLGGVVGGAHTVADHP
ncbi:hypothetical protein ACUY2Q_00555, partial [Corynebacterium bovis]